MKKYSKKFKEQIQELQSKAEEILSREETVDNSGNTLIIEELLHEVHIQQIELEMQNEELRRTQVELENARAYYVDLFEYSPIGYLTLNMDCVIRASNLTSAKMLGWERSKLIERNFNRFIPDDYKDGWHRIWQHAKKNNIDINGFELPLLNIDGRILFFYIKYLPLPFSHAPDLLHITLTDITLSKKSEEAQRIAAAAFETQDGIFVPDINK